VNAGLSIESRVKKLEDGATAPSKTVREWLLFLLALIGAVIGIWNFVDARRIDRRIAAKEALAKAWDALGGKPGTTELPAIRYSLNDLELARREVEKALELAPGLSETHRRNCVLLRLRKRLAEALGECQVALDLDPNNAAAANSLGNVFRARQNFQKAAEYYRRAVKAEDALPAYTNLVAVLRMQSKFQDALLTAEKEVSTFPDNGVPYYDRGLCLLSLGRAAEARVDFERALGRDPNLKNAIEHLSEAPIQATGS
jgi:tetratricopeptide (TPR) repeat protein